MNREKTVEKDSSSKQFPLVAVVIVTMNRYGLLSRVLNQLRSLDYPRENFDIFLLDNGSTDETAEKIPQQFPEVHLTVSRENVGPTFGWNLEIKKILNAERDYKYIWLLDNDSEINSQTLMPLVEAAENDPGIAVIGSAVFEPDSRDQVVNAGAHIDWKKMSLVFNKPGPDEIDDLFDVDIIPACSSITRTDLFRKLGIFDERFWLWGDNEWCVRALRSGYRVCCYGKSRVWHRNWLNVRRVFHTPVLIHGNTRAELLFYLFNSPLLSIAGLRKYILRCYLKAAFENLTMRPNFSRAYHEGVQDFLRGYFSKKDISSWSNGLEMGSLEDICRGLSGKISKKPRIILNQIDDEAQKEKIKEVFQNYFDKIQWEDIPVKAGIDQFDPSDRVKDFLFIYFPRLLLRLFMIFNKKDVIVSLIAAPHLLNIAAAKYTIFLDTSLSGFILENRIIEGFKKFFATIIKGVRVVYIQYPLALKTCRALKKPSAVYSSSEIIKEG